MYQTLIAPVTQNAKLGLGVATTYRPVGDSALGQGTCPSTCALLNNGCYAQKKLVNMNQKRATDRHDDLDRLTSKGARFVRLHTSGDFFKAKCGGGFELDVEYFEAILQWCEANPRVTVWTYCHSVRKLVEAGYSYIQGVMPKNLHIVASSDNDADKDFALHYGFRTSRVMSDVSEKADNETFCPYDLALSKGEKPKTTCVNCTLCFNEKHKKNIAFMKH